MRTTAGIFNSRDDAERAVERLRSLGLAEERVSLLAPGADAEEIAESVPTTETEQPGLGRAFGGVAGGAIGAAGGLHLGAAVASLFVPVAAEVGRRRAAGREQADALLRKPEGEQAFDGALGVGARLENPGGGSHLGERVRARLNVTRLQPDASGRLSTTVGAEQRLTSV